MCPGRMPDQVLVPEATQGHDIRMHSTSVGCAGSMRRIAPPPEGRADMHWFTADPHYSHDRIIGFCGRPFPDTTMMNARLPAA